MPSLNFQAIRVVWFIFSFTCLGFSLRGEALPLSSLNLTFSRPAPQPTNTTISMTATPTGGSAVEYLFLVGFIDGETIRWQIPHAYSTNNTCRWRPTKAGTYRIEAWAREIGQTVDYQVRASHNYIVIIKPLNQVVLQIVPVSPQPILTTVLLTAVPDGIGCLQFRFDIGQTQPDGSVTWGCLQDFSPSSTSDWEPTVAGQYTIQVQARQGGTEATVFTDAVTFTAIPLTGAVLDQYLAVAPYRGNKTAALSYTFDDGMETLIHHAVPLLDAFALKGTFFVVPSWIPEHTPQPYPDAAASWDEWRAVAAEGHEIGNHSMTHQDLTQITDQATLDSEIYDSATIIWYEIGRYPLSFAYPDDAWNDHVRDLVLVNHVADRVNIVEYDGSDFTAQYADACVDQAIANRQWLVSETHAIDDGSPSPLPSRELSQHFQYVTDHLDQLWVDTFGNISLYSLEQQHAALQLQGCAPNSLTFTLTCSLYPVIFDTPLTVVIPLDAGSTVTNVTAVQAGDTVPLPVSVVPGGILLDVVPGTAPVTVTWEG